AIKYRDDPGASERLTRIVMTGSNPRAPHWTGKAGAVTMPPNATDVTEADARVFVNRILVLVLQRGGPEPETGFAESRAGVVYRSTRSAPKTR
ncbi:MAG: hypothetical protein ABI781_15780, partial [Burkholderiales bacterium]